MHGWQLAGGVILINHGQKHAALVRAPTHATLELTRPSRIATLRARIPLRAFRQATTLRNHRMPEGRSDGCVRRRGCVHSNNAKWMFSSALLQCSTARRTRLGWWVGQAERATGGGNTAAHESMPVNSRQWGVGRGGCTHLSIAVVCDLGRAGGEADSGRLSVSAWRRVDQCYMPASE
jgi:hypothetical protein